MRWLYAWRCCIAVALTLAMPAAATSSPVHRIVAVGDLHGDFAVWRDIARAAQLVDDQGHWIGGEAVLVQTGDVVDRGPDSLKIIQEFMRLQSEALRAHGQVIALVGNHEAMNLIGDLRYMSAADFAAYADGRSAQRREDTYAANKAAIEVTYRQHAPQMTSDAIKQAWIEATPLGRLEHQVAWSPNGKIGRWVVSNPAITLLDGNLFVHGGISPVYARLPIAEINRQVRAALMAQDTTPQAIINDPLGPLWYRGLATPSVDVAGAPSVGTQAASVPAAPVERPIEDRLEFLLSAYGAKRIVIGHTPVLSGIAVTYGGRLIRIDTGNSDVYGGTASYLDIIDGIPIPHVVERSPHQ